MLSYRTAEEFGERLDAAPEITQVRAKAGISDGLLRLSVGIESADDLLAILNSGCSARSRTGGRVSRVVALTALRPATPRLALLGTGVVGRAFVDRYQRLRQRNLSLPPLAWLGNSRALHQCGEAPDRALAAANAAPRAARALPPWTANVALSRGDVLVDATASNRVADRHAEWLSRGVHVVTANKLEVGGAAARAQSIFAASGESGARYGDSATVGRGPAAAAQPARAGGRRRSHPSHRRHPVRLAGLAVQPL